MPAAQRTGSTPAERLVAELLREVLGAPAVLKKAATAAHMSPPRSGDTMTTCHFSMGRVYPAAEQSPHNREKAASVLHAAGWTDSLTGGSDESHLTGDGWDVFITRLTGGTDSNGNPAETLQINADCQ